MVKLTKGALPLQPNNQVEALKSKTKDAAKMFEKQFLREMVKAMRSTVPKNGLIKKNQAERIFQEKLDHEYVEKWGDRGGIGLSDLIYNQIMDRFGAQMGIVPAGSRRPKGPIQFKKFPQAQVSKQSVGRAESISLKNLQTDKQVGKIEVTAPWSGILVDSKLLESGQTLNVIEHDNGLTSKILYSGSKLLGKGDSVQAGESIGQILSLNTSEESKMAKGELSWQLSEQTNGQSSRQLIENASSVHESVDSAVSL